MAQKAKRTTKQTQLPAKQSDKQDKNVPVSKQTAGGVTGAVLGAVVAGPVGALAGGVTGALVGDAAAKGRKPIKRAVDAIRSELSEAHLGDRLRSVKDTVTTKIKSLRAGKKAKAAPSKKQAAPAGVSTKKSKAKTAKKTAKAATKRAAAPKKKRAKNKS
jgi:hypothetical protein